MVVGLVLNKLKASGDLQDINPSSHGDSTWWYFHWVGSKGGGAVLVSSVTDRRGAARHVVRLKRAEELYLYTPPQSIFLQSKNSSKGGYRETFLGGT